MVLGQKAVLPQVRRGSPYWQQIRLYKDTRLGKAAAAAAASAGGNANASAKTSSGGNGAESKLVKDLQAQLKQAQKKLEDQEKPEDDEEDAEGGAVVARELYRLLAAILAERLEADGQNTLVALLKNEKAFGAPADVGGRKAHSLTWSGLARAHSAMRDQR